jgi:hypothetical protein
VQVPLSSSFRSQISSDNDENIGDASYSFNIDTDTYKRQESSDPRGNIQGRYSYSNKDGVHDLTYVAGENTGFVATSGSLSEANGFKSNHALQVNPSTRQRYTPETAKSPVSEINTDGSYAFAYTNDDSARQETADAGNNVQGRYSYKNGAGQHDLSYVAGAQTGFVVTGGNLAQPNSLSYSQPSAPLVPSFYSASGPVSSSDGSYAFEYSAPDHSRQEKADSEGNVRGYYSFKNEAGNHDLSYIAGSSTGFLPTGGSLSPTNQPSGTIPKSAYSVSSTPTYEKPSTYSRSQTDAGDSSYNFNINTDDYQRQETSDASGNIQGKFSYKNSAGVHDLSYVAGAKTGFLPTGGSLAAPKTAIPSSSLNPVAPVVPKTAILDRNEDDQPDTGDSSYSFKVDTDEYKRQESSDAKGNVRGSFSYKNADGTHDLSYVAGANTGFVATGGSLVDPIVAKNAILSKSGQNFAPPLSRSSIDLQNPNDASYSFSVDTDDYKRHEVSDANGNVQGSFSYKNSVGNHGLSFVAGSATGFLPTGGSLKVAPGVSESQSGGGLLTKSFSKATSSPTLLTRTYPDITNGVIPSSYTLDKNVVVHSYLPPSNEKNKFGYIFEML